MYPPLDVGLGRSLPDVVLNAGIDQDVEAPEFFSDLYRQMVDAFGVGHVELLCDNAAPNLRGQCPRGGLAFLRILGTKNHGVTEPFQLPNHLISNSTVVAADQRYFIERETRRHPIKHARY